MASKGFGDFSNHVQSCSSFKPSCLSEITDDGPLSGDADRRKSNNMSQLIETSFKSPVVLHNPWKEVPRSLERALGLSAPSEAIVFSMAAVPEAVNFVALADWLKALGIDPRRGVALHYRTQQLPSGWLSGLVRNSPGPHDVGAASLQQAFWNNYWVTLWQVAKADAVEQLCQGRPGTACDERQLIKWCAAREDKVLSREVPPRRNKTFLLLGGDAQI